MVSLDGVVPSWMVGMSASVSLPLHHKVQNFSHPGGPRRRAIKWLWCGVTKSGSLQQLTSVQMVNDKQCFVSSAAANRPS